MQSIIANDQPAALSDAFRCLVKDPQKAGVLRHADLENRRSRRYPALASLTGSAPYRMSALALQS